MLQLFAGCGYTGNGKKERGKIVYYQGKADSSYKSKNYQEAALYFDSLILLDGKNPMYYFKRAYSRSILQGDPNQIISDYESALALGFKEKKKVYLNLGFIFLMVDKKDSGLYYTNKCLELDPDNEKAKENKSHLLQLP